MAEKRYKDLSFMEEIAVMETGVVYLIPAPFCSIDRDILDEIESSASEYGESYDYVVKTLSRKEIPSQFSSWENLLNTTVVLPVFMPDQEESHYLVAFCKKDNLNAVVQEMVTDAEAMSKESSRNALINLAYNDPDYFEEILYSENLIFDDEEDTHDEKTFLEKAKEAAMGLGKVVFGHLTDLLSPGPMMMGMPMSSCPDCSMSEEEIDSQIASLKETNEMIKRFLSNVKKLKETNDPIARKEVDWVIDNSVGFSDKLWKRIFKECDVKTQKDIFMKFIDRNTLGKKSKIIISIEKTPREEVVKNVGRYRISVRPDGWAEDDRKFISFKHQATCVVYMMYLIDRSDRKKKVDCLRLSSNMANFKSLYKSVYGFGANDVDLEVEKLLTEKPKDESKSYRSGKLRHCYHDISTTFSRELEDIESPVPFMVNRSSHLTIDPEHIIIPKELKKLHFS